VFLQSLDQSNSGAAGSPKILDLCDFLRKIWLDPIGFYFQVLEYDWLFF